MKNRFILLTLMLCFLSCNQKKIQNDYSGVSIDHTSDFPIQNLISEVKLHPLDVTDDFLISDIDKIIKQDSIYYLLDRKMKSLFLFSDKGKPLLKFQNVGKGPDEYITIEDFDMMGNKLLLLCEPSKVFVLTNKLEIEKVISLEKSYYNLVGYKENIYLYDFYENEIDRLDLDKNKTETIWKGDLLEGQVYGSTSPFFKTENNNELYFQSLHDIDIYKFEDNTFKKNLSLNYKNRDETVKFLKKADPMDIKIQDRIKYYTPTVISLKTKEDKLIIIYTFGRAFKGCIYNSMDHSYIDGIIRNYPGLGDSTYWGENLLGKMPAFEVDLDFFLNYEYLKGIPIEFEYEYPDSDNPVITECITKF